MSMILQSVSVVWPADREPGHPEVGYAMHVRKFVPGEEGVEQLSYEAGAVTVEKEDGSALHFANVPFMAEYVEEPEEPEPPE